MSFRTLENTVKKKLPIKPLNWVTLSSKLIRTQKEET